MASEDAPNLSREKANPALGLDDSRLTSLLFQVIGVNGVESIGLPSDPPLSKFRRTRQLVLRLQWIFDAVQATCVNITASSPSLSGPTSLRILLFVLKVGSSAELNAGSEADYSLWRHITLNTITSATRTFLLSKHVASLEEEDHVLDGLQNLRDIWRKKQELSAIEKVLLNDILPYSISAQNEMLSRSTREGPRAETESLISAVTGTPIEAKENFWALHDRVSEITWCLSGIVNIDSAMTFDFSSAHQLIDLACERSREKDVYRTSAAIIHYQMERLASTLRVWQDPQLWHEDEDLLDTQLAMRMSRIVRMEKEEFGRSFLTFPTPAVQHSQSVQNFQSVQHPQPFQHSQSVQHAQSIQDLRTIQRSQSYQTFQSISQTVSPISPADIKFEQIYDPNEGERALDSDSIHLDLDSSKDSTSEFGLIPLSAPTQQPQRKSTLAAIPTSTEDTASLYLPEAIPSPEFTTESIDLNLDLRPQSKSSSTEKSSSFDKASSIERSGGWTKVSMSKLMKSVSKSSKQPLPSSLDFCFSGPGNRIALWCREVTDRVVLIDPLSLSGQRYAMVLPQLPTHKRCSKKIRHLCSSGTVVVSILHIEDSRWLYQSVGNTLRPALLLDENMPSVNVLSLSPDGRHVALGCGKCIYVYTRVNNELRGPRRLPILNNTDGQAVRAHKLNFSVDSTKLISCIQVKNKSPQNALYVSIWAHNDSGFGLDSQLSPILLSEAVLGYSDETGISSVYLAGEPDPRYTQHVFLTAALSKPYPAIIPLTPGAKYKMVDLQNKRIDSSAQCLVSSASHFIAVKSGYHEIYRVDVRSGTSELVANFSKDRRYIQNHPIALSMGDSDTVYSLWRTGNQGLVLKTSVLGSGKWATTSVDIAPMYRHLAETP